jgi:hypothetical protein
LLALSLLLALTQPSRWRLRVARRRPKSRSAVGSHGLRRPQRCGRRPSPWVFFLRKISHRWGTDSHRSEDDQAALRRSVSSRPRRRIFTGC